MRAPASLSVVIPTYQRPIWIRRAVRSLAIQGRAPDEVIAVARDTDLPTHEAIAELQREKLPFTLRRELVTEPGFMPPVRAGLALAEGDIIAVMDDEHHVGRLAVVALAALTRPRECALARCLPGPCRSPTACASSSGHGARQTSGQSLPGERGSRIQRRAPSLAPVAFLE